jgi:hypothetical protein
MAISGFCCRARSTACRRFKVCTSARSAAAQHTRVKILVKLDMLVLSQE